MPKSHRLAASMGMGMALVLASASALPAQIPAGITLSAAFGTAGSGSLVGIAAMEEIPGKPGHFLVAQFSGKMTLLTPDGAGGHSRSPFLSVGTNDEEDKGLSPFAFHPRFTSNRKYYVRYGIPGDNPRRSKIEEREASADFLRDNGTARTLLTFDLPPEFSDHNGGGFGFGPDGFLYIGVGDGGWDIKTPDVHNNGQNRESLLGKVLRIDVNRKDPGLEYGIPADNPFVSDANPKVRKEIFAYGLRNPYRLSFDRATGELYVADVGLSDFEKVFILKRGGNYGWKLKEHTLCYVPGSCDNITVEPSAAYMAYGPVKCFIGGHVYRGDPTSPFYGVYLFGDHTMKRLLAFRKGSAPVVATDLSSTPGEMTGFTLDSQNNLYMLGYKGTIYKLNHADLRPMASSIRVAARPRLRIFTGRGSALGVRHGGPTGVFSLDGTRLGSLDAEGNFVGRQAVPAGILLLRSKNGK